MKYLESFTLVDEEENFDLVRQIKNKYTQDEWFPLGFFFRKKLTQIDFEPITIFYGGNGSGKSSLLNVIAEKFGFLRHSHASVTKGFREYVRGCNSKHVKEFPPHSKMLTSEDVFKNIFSTRSDNLAVDEKKDEVEEFFDYGQLDFAYEGIMGAELINKDIAKKQYVEKRAGYKQRTYSNGENAIKFFKDEIQRKTLYLLDEPENSMSPQYQIELKLFLEDCVKYYGCQFVIATHSPFILALKGAKIYNLDRRPVQVEPWYELKNVRAYYDFFRKNRELFGLGQFDTASMPKPKRKTTT